MEPNNSEYPPVELDECKYLILKIIEQAVRDVISLSTSSAPVERSHYDTACEFLFDDNYTIEWGDEIKSLRDLLDILDIDLVWFRERVARLKGQRHKVKSPNGIWYKESNETIATEESEE